MLAVAPADQRSQAISPFDNNSGMGPTDVSLRKRPSRSGAMRGRRKKARVAVLQPNDKEKLSLLVELSFEPIIVWDFERGIVDWNHGSERLYGFTSTEAVGCVIHDLLQTVHPVPLKEILAQLDVQGKWKGELRHTTKSGRKVIVESRQQSAKIGGRRVVLETNHDITEIRRSELNARFIIQLDLAIAQITDPD